MSAAKHAKHAAQPGDGQELSLDNPHDLGNHPSRVPVWAQRVGIGLLVAVIVLSGFWAATEHWRRATFALGVGMIWLGILRLTCDSKIIGVLAVRSVRFDVLFCFATGGIMAFLSASVDALGS